VIVVVLENQEMASVLAKGPFEETLSDNYAFFNQSYAICHPSEPNYLAMTSGRAVGRCGTDAYRVLPVANVGDLLEAHHFTWRTYVESMPHPCDVNNSYPYAVKHNPFVFYKDIVQNTTRCDQHVVDFNAWNSSVANGTIPNYAYLVPNLLNDGHDTTIRYADHWLKGWLTPLLSKAWFQHTAVFLTYDEGLLNTGFTQANQTFTGGHIFTAVISPYTPNEGNFSTNVTHYNQLSTIEWLFGLGSLHAHDNPNQFPPTSSIFEFSATDDSNPGQ
jgi:hypothetical protein